MVKTVFPKVPCSLIKWDSFPFVSPIFCLSHIIELTWKQKRNWTVVDFGSPFPSKSSWYLDLGIRDSLGLAEPLLLKLPLSIMHGGIIVVAYSSRYSYTWWRWHNSKLCWDDASDYVGPWCCKHAVRHICTTQRGGEADVGSSVSLPPLRKQGNQVSCAGWAWSVQGLERRRDGVPRGGQRRWGSDPSIHSIYIPLFKQKFMPDPSLSPRTAESSLWLLSYLFGSVPLPEVA